MSKKFGFDQVDCVLFDFDGTLVDSREAVLRTFAKFAAMFGVNVTEQVVSRFDGLTTYEIVETAKTEWKISAAINALTEQYFSMLATTYAQVAECPGALVLLKALEARCYRLGLVTSAPQQLIEPVLERLGWTNLFDRKIYGKRGVSGKPNPALYNLALASLGTELSHVIAVEDSVSGVRAAAAAGIPVIAVSNEMSRPQLLEAGAILVTDDLAVISRVLQ